MGMLDELGLNFGKMLGITDIAMTVLWIIVMLLVAGGVGYGVMIFSQYKHKVRIRDLTSDRKRIIDDKVKEYRDSEGLDWWRFYKLKFKISSPPPRVVDLDDKGRKVAEGYRLSNDEVIWIQDAGQDIDPPNDIYDNIPSSILNIKDTMKKYNRIQKWKADKLNEWQKKNHAIGGFKPFTTNQRQIMINQMQKAQERKQKRWQDMILPVAGISAIVILVVSLMIFYEDMGKPLIEMGKQVNTFKAKDLEQTKILERISNDVQEIKSDRGGPPG